MSKNFILLLAIGFAFCGMSFIAMQPSNGYEAVVVPASEFAKIYGSSCYQHDPTKPAGTICSTSCGESNQSSNGALNGGNKLGAERRCGSSCMMTYQCYDGDSCAGG